MKIPSLVVYGKPYRLKTDQTQIVYRCRYHDYGLANDDTRATGIKHISVTLDPEGGYPLFTVPADDLELVEVS